MMTTSTGTVAVENLAPGTAVASIRINLMPVARRERGAVRRRTRHWVGIVTGYTAAVVVALGFCALRWVPAVRDLGGELDKTEEQIASLRLARAKVQGELGEAQTRLDSVEALLGQPDWSALMAILADSLGDEVVLDSVRLELVPDKTAPIAPAPASTLVSGAKPVATVTAVPNNKWVLRTGGYAKTPATVSHFVLRMEGLDLFDHVRLLKTNHEPFRTGEATSFQIECPLKGRGRIGR